MKVWCGALLALLSITPAFAQGVPRIKASITAFDGQTLTIVSGSGSSAQSMTVGVMPSTRIERQESRALADIKAGDYVGATIVTGRDGLHHAQEVHVFSQDLRGNSEGIFAVTGDRSMIGGTVRQAGADTLRLDFRGADGGDGAACTGRAPKTGGCHGSADILVAPGTSRLLSPGTSAVTGTPGAVVAVSVMAGPDGRPVTPGLMVQSPPTVQSPVPSPAAPAHAPAGKVPGH